MDIEGYISSGIIEQYVMGLCTEEEKNELEQMRRQHTSIHQAILNFEIAWEENMMQASILPSAATDDKILQALHSFNTPVVSINKQNNKSAGINLLKYVSAAAIILLGASTIFNYTLYHKNKKQEQELALQNIKTVTLPESDYSVLKNPAITPVAMYGVGYHTICRCTMFWDKKTGKAYIMIHHLIKSSDTKDYQLWAMVNGKPVSIGIIDDGIRDRFIEVSNVPLGAKAFSITLENAGGVAAPTIEETYLEGKI